jgi:hypothetical protein
MPSKKKTAKKPAKNPASKSTDEPAMFEQPAVPENFANLIVDFTRDLSVTFPEYSHLWQQWSTLEMPEVEVRNLFDYCLSVYPERFFDILYQNADIFKADSEANTCFLPGVEFKTLYNCENVSENTRKAIWKYLQVIMLAAVNAVKDKTGFGDTMNMFDGIDEADLQSKLAETISGISEFFKMGKDSDSDSDVEDVHIDGQEQTGMPDFSKTFDFEKMAGSMPNAESLHGHLKGLFDGKIGTLAKEMAEEISHDFENILGGEGANINSTQDVLKQMMKNPKKIMDLMKTVGAKLNTKMDSGEISKDDLMKEATEWIGKMKDMGGSDQFGELFKNLTKNMGGLGKNMKFDENAFKRMTKEEASKDRIRNKLQQRKAANELLRQQAMAQAQKNAQNVVLESTAPNNYVFRVDGEGPQEKSVKKSKAEMDKELDDLVASIGVENTNVAPKKSAKSKKSKGKK